MIVKVMHVLSRGMNFVNVKNSNCPLSKPSQASSSPMDLRALDTELKQILKVKEASFDAAKIGFVLAARGDVEKQFWRSHSRKSPMPYGQRREALGNSSHPSLPLTRQTSVRVSVAVCDEPAQC